MDRTAAARMARYREKKRNEIDGKRNVLEPPIIKSVTVDKDQAVTLLLICNALDKTIHGLDGKVNLLSMVRYGVYGPTMESVKAQLDG